MEKPIRMPLDGPNAAGGSEDTSSDQEGEEIMNTLLMLYCTEISRIHVSQEKTNLIRKSNYDMVKFQESDQRESGLQAARPHTAHKTPQYCKPQTD